MQAESTSPPSESECLASVRAMALRGDLAAAERSALQALRSYPDSVELRRALGGIYRQAGHTGEAERLLRALLADRPDDVAAAFTLAELLRDAGRLSAAAEVLTRSFVQTAQDAELAIRAIELLADCGRTREAAQIAESAMVAAPDDVRLHAYAGMLDIQIGEFARAREHYLYALDHDPRACEWHAPLGLSTAQRYAEPDDPDFARFAQYLQRSDLSEKARASLLFAIAKAHDDVGDYRQAAIRLREANELAHRNTRWSRKQWRRALQSRLEAKPYTHRLEAAADFVPLFVVGMPRTGTTLVAELLARHAQVCNRGELPWLPKIAQIPDLAGDPAPGLLRQAAGIYQAQCRQDDSTARWFVDKQPLNFRYIGLMLALWPNARIVHCRRNARDTALSLWMQAFFEDVQGYAHDFSDIAMVMRDCDRLMTHWTRRHAVSICTLEYEQLVAEPQQVIGELAEWLGLPKPGESVQDVGAASSISTASLWQARQPIHTRSVGRWRNYAEFVPELLKFPDAIDMIAA